MKNSTVSVSVLKGAVFLAVVLLFGCSDATGLYEACATASGEEASMFGLCHDKSVDGGSTSSDAIGHENPFCTPNVTDPEAVRRPIAQFGVWHWKGWNICVMGQTHLDEPLNIEAYGFGYKANELDGYNQPASLVNYSGVMGSKCVLMKPEDASSDGPILKGDGVKGDATTGVTISDGETTVEWDNPISTYCAYEYLKR